MAERKPEIKEIPDVIVGNGKRYMKGKFLGKGGFARCYELTDLETKEVFAGKIVSKQLLQKKHQKDKMTQEIAIHRSLSHEHVVKLHSFFEDADNVYVLLEICRRRSMMELHKRRRAITEPEARYFMHQVVIACIYLHETKVIHRDLKLGNLFLNDEMQVKIGDFGLATNLQFDGERKKTLCGTPNYIAPEMLGKKGHSFEVDIWALGCILFTLLVGKPPFETQSLKETYLRIKKNEYHIPSRVGQHARQMIQRLLAAEPSRRPTIQDVAKFDFFTQGFMPTRLPTSCLTMAPKFTSASQLPQLTNNQTGRRPLVDTVNQDVAMMSPKEKVRKDLLAAPIRPLNTVPEGAALVGASADAPTRSASVRPPSAMDTDVAAAAIGGSGNPMMDGMKGESDVPSDYFLSDLYKQLSEVVHSKPSERMKIQEDEAEDPAATPVFWISKWVDYSDKYGLGYQLCDNSVGVLFNDNTKLVLDPAGEQLQYIEKDNREHYYTAREFAPEISKKVTLLQYFRNYMNDHLLKAGAHMAPKEGDELARLPCLKTWFRTKSAIILHLTNGTLQVNFFQDHTKVILCPLMGAVTYIDERRNFKTYRFSLVEQFGCGKDLASRIRYARTMVERLLTSSSSSRPGALSTVKTVHNANSVNGTGASITGNQNLGPPIQPPTAQRR